MTEPHIDHVKEWLHDPQHTTSKSLRDPQQPILKRLMLVLMLAGLCSLTLSGCDNFWDTAVDLLDGGSAEAQEDGEERIETFTITTNTFTIRVDNDGDGTPTHVVSDSATVFTMQSSGDVLFDSTTEPVELDDVIILRPNGTTGTVTIIRVD